MFIQVYRIKHKIQALTTSYNTNTYTLLLGCRFLYRGDGFASKGTRQAAWRCTLRQVDDDAEGSAAGVVAAGGSVESKPSHGSWKRR